MRLIKKLLLLLTMMTFSYYLGLKGVTPDEMVQYFKDQNVVNQAGKWVNSIKDNDLLQKATDKVSEIKGT